MSHSPGFPCNACNEPENGALQAPPWETTLVTPVTAVTALRAKGRARGSPTSVGVTTWARVMTPHVDFTQGESFHLLFADKVCGTCQERKPLSNFAPHNGARDGRRNHCRSCCSTDRYRPQIEGPEARAKRNARQCRPDWQRSHREALRRWAERYPLANKAKRIAQSALKAGKIEKAPHCQALGCMSTKHIELHHNDYSRPLEVLTVCAAHHRLGHSVGYIPVAPGLPAHLGNIPERA
jgi:hypothetical protein